MRKGRVLLGTALSTLLVGTLAGPALADDDQPLATVETVRFAESEGYFVVVGRDSAGDLDTYFGDHGSWTKLQENRDAQNAPSEYVDFAIGDVSNDDSLDGVAVGNGMIGNQQFRRPQAYSSNIREFSDKPWFDSGTQPIR